MEQPDQTTKAGTIGGTLLVVIIQIRGDELIKTAILAAVGASVSFGVTLLWKKALQRMRRKRG